MGPQPAAPCGLCRQTAAEFDPQLPVVLATVSGQRRLVTLDQLLPDAFTRADLPPQPPA
jgi:cytidine deaminase